MLASELLEQLKKEIEKHGDMEVTTPLFSIEELKELRKCIFCTEKQNGFDALTGFDIRHSALITIQRLLKGKS